MKTGRGAGWPRKAVVPYTSHSEMGHSQQRQTHTVTVHATVRGRAGASPLAGVVVAVSKQMSRAHVHLRHDAVVVAHCQHPLQG